RAGELILVIVGGVLVWRSLIEKAPMPRGAVALVGVALTAVVLAAPFINIASLSDFQAATYDQGIIRFMLMAILFVAAYHIGWDARKAMRLVYVVVFMTVVEGSIAIYETMTGRPSGLLGSIWTTVGFDVDPSALSLRGETETLLLRLTGELRAAATAPHPLVLSAVLALGVLIALVVYFRADEPVTRRRAGIAALVQMAAAAATNSRTGFVMVIVIGVVIAVIYSYKTNELLQMSFVALFGIPVIFFVSPDTPRLLLNFFTGVRTDQNVDVRIERFAVLPDLIAEHPFIGAGYLTHDPGIQIFDNAYNLAVVELGFIGLGLMLAFIFTVLIRTLPTAFRHRRTDSGIVAMGAVAAISMLLGAATFDAWTFDQFLPTCVLLMGLGVARADALWDRGKVAAGSPATDG
ncbi:MAG: hypothetical protein OEM97_07975, partial [Acidimicrobiia bacterium]|nr:hypothetical protein [Acidimicrobiia bacterium]